MHELSVTEHILNIALKHASENHAVKVTDIYLTIGRLSSVIDDSVQFYWDIVSRDTLCQSAILHFNRIEARLLCRSCQHEFTLGGELTVCPRCQSPQLQVKSGEEFFLESIAIEKEPVA